MSATAEGADSNSIEVGSRVRTTDSPAKTGTVVEDFGDLSGQEVIIDATHRAKSRRWAVALDDGTLAFLDDDALELAD